MAYRFFVVPANSDGALEDELNSFLASHRVLCVDRRFIDRGENAYWAFCIEYLAGAGSAAGGSFARKGTRVDYKEILTPAQFQIFVKLRELRQKLSQVEAVPVYTIFTNEQLAAMVQNHARSQPDLEAIPGIGAARVGKYGEAFLQIMRENDASAG